MRNDPTAQLILECSKNFPVSLWPQLILISIRVKMTSWWPMSGYILPMILNSEQTTPDDKATIQQVQNPTLPKKNANQTLAKPTRRQKPRKSI